MNSTYYKYLTPWDGLNAFFRKHDINVHERPMVGSSIGHFDIAIRSESVYTAVEQAQVELLKQLEGNHNIWWRTQPRVDHDFATSNRDGDVYVALLRGAHW
jgi:hypothetical protein